MKKKKKKEMIPLTDERNNPNKKQKVIYANKDLVLIMIIKSTIKLEITVITQEDTEELLTVFIT